MRRLCSGLATIVLSVGALAAPAAASSTRWTPIGLGGGPVYGIAVDPTSPSTVYASTDGGAYRSVDSGTTWRLRSRGLTTSELTRIAVAPSDHLRIYAGTTFAGVAGSTDGGSTWTSSASGLTDDQISALAVDPTDPNVSYVGTSRTGVFKSTDGGATWSASGLHQHIVRSLAIDPTSGIVYAGATDGVFKSLNAGATWIAVGNGLPTQPFTYALVLAPSAPSTVFVSIQGVVYKSVNGGGVWSKANTGMTGFVLTLAIDPAAPSKLLAGTAAGGLFDTVDGGQTWTHVTSSVLPEEVSVLTMDPTNGQTVYAGGCSGKCFFGGTKGLFKSTDGGQTWTRSGQGIRAVDTKGVALDTAHGRISIATDRGFSWSNDAGGSWHLSNTGLTDMSILTMVADPNDPATFYLGTDCGGIFKSIDAGASWVSVSSGLPQCDVWYGLAVDPTNSQILYAAPNDFASTAGVYKSINGGAKWRRMSQGLPSNLPVDTLVVDPTSHSSVYAGTLDGVYKTTDGAVTWNRMDNGLTNFNVSVVVLDPATPQTVFAGTVGGVFKSTDGAASWSPSSTGLTTRDIRSLAVLGNGSVYAGTLGGGVFVSANAGATWAPWNSGLHGDWVHAFAADGSNLYAATVGGLFVRPLG